MPIKPKDSRLIGFNRVKPRLQRLPKRQPIPAGITLAKDSKSGSVVAYNPPSSSPNPLVTPTPFLPAHLRAHTLKQQDQNSILPPALMKPKEKTFLTAEQIEEIKSLRASGLPAAAIARRFSTTSMFVSLVAPLPKSVRQVIKEKEKAEKASWSPRRQAVHEVRQLKRATWGLS